MAHGTWGTNNEPLNNPPRQAREILNIWKQDSVPQGAIEPWQNAESIADAALGKLTWPSPSAPQHEKSLG